MKKLFQIIIVVVLLIVLYFQYMNYRRFHPPQGYDYAVAGDVDTDYYDLAALQQYYENAHKIGTFARSQWYNHGLDVKFPGEDTESLRAAGHYTRLIAVTRALEGKLRHSLLLKQKGYGNKDIKYMFEEGVGEEEYALRNYEYLIGLHLGDMGPEVYFIQEQLRAAGHDTPADGKFLEDCEATLKVFQSENKLLATGVLDKETLVALLKGKRNN